MLCTLLQTELRAPRFRGGADLPGLKRLGGEIREPGALAAHQGDMS
jgi:hypothetical protein